MMNKHSLLLTIMESCVGISWQ